MSFGSIKYYCAFVVAIIFANIPLAAQNVTASDKGETLLSVRAEGSVSSMPDVMEINASVFTQAKIASDAGNQNAIAINKILSAVEPFGIKKGDIQTSGYSLEPRLETDKSGNEIEGGVIVGYEVRNRLSIVIRDLSKAGELLNVLYTAGATNISGPNFSLSDKNPAFRSAERKALLLARAKADNMADTLGLKIVRIVRINDRRSYGDDDGDQIIVTGSRVKATPIEPGTLLTTVEVQVDFALAPK